MSHDPKSMSCHEFQEQLAELVGAGENVANHPHLQNCDLCKALLRDLETIAEAARELFPIQPPEDGLWDRIESAIKKEEAELPKAD